MTPVTDSAFHFDEKTALDEATEEIEYDDGVYQDHEERWRLDMFGRGNGRFHR